MWKQRVRREEGSGEKRRNHSPLWSLQLTPTLSFRTYLRMFFCRTHWCLSCAACRSALVGKTPFTFLLRERSLTPFSSLLSLPSLPSLLSLLSLLFLHLLRSCFPLAKLRCDTSVTLDDTSGSRQRRGEGSRDHSSSTQLRRRRENRSVNGVKES